MRFMVIIKADADTEKGVMPSEKLLEEMGNFNEELVNAGIMLAGDGLQPSSKAKRVYWSKGKHTVVDGPFAETKELIAGYWIWKLDSIEQAVEWVKRCPNPLNGDWQIEIRPFYEADDLGPEFTAELRAQEDRLRERIASQQQ